MPINSFSGEHKWLSNFYPVKLALWDDGLIYNSVEHAYQAFKTTDPKERESIRNCDTPGKAKRLGTKVTLRSDWNEDIRLFAMYVLVMAKFVYGDLRDKLLATGDEEIIEGNNWGDTFWGVCDGQGRNELGKILMKVRQYYKDNKDARRL